MPQRGREKGDESGHQKHERDMKIEERHGRKDQDGRERRHRELGEVLPEVHFELLHSLDHRQDDVARARLGEVRRTESDDVIVEVLAKPRLDQGRRAVRDHGAPVFECSARQDDQACEGDGRGQGGEGVPRKDPAEQPPQEGKAGNAGDHLEEADTHRGRDAQADTPREAPQPSVEVHARSILHNLGRDSKASGLLQTLRKMPRR